MHLDDGMDLRPTSARTARFAPALYPAALFLSALLLFAIQPMFTKMVLPRIGGAAAVWSVAMVFFQAALLLGYAYAHLLSRTLSPAPAALVHLGLLAVAATTLPIGIAQGFEAAPQGGSSSGCWRCLPHRSVCRSSRSPRAHPCCKTGSQRAVIRTRQTPTFSMRRPISGRS